MRKELDCHRGTEETKELAEAIGAAAQEFEEVEVAQNLEERSFDSLRSLRMTILVG